MTNVGTETAFRHDQRKHFEKVNIRWGQRSVDAIKLVYTCWSWTPSIYKLSVTDFDPKGTISEVRVHAKLYLGTRCWSIAKYSRISTKFSSLSSRSFDHRGKTKKETVKNTSKNEKKKTPERPRRSARKIDEHVIDYACEDACVKVANVKSVKKCSPGEGVGGGGGRDAPKCPQEDLRVPTYSIGGGDV